MASRARRPDHGDAAEKSSTMASEETRHRRALLRRIVIEPREAPDRPPSKRMNRGNRARIAALREREQYLGTVIEEKRLKGAKGLRLHARRTQRPSVGYPDRGSVDGRGPGGSAMTGRRDKSTRDGPSEEAVRKALQTLADQPAMRRGAYPLERTDVRAARKRPSDARRGAGGRVPRHRRRPAQPGRNAAARRAGATRRP